MLEVTELGDAELELEGVEGILEVVEEEPLLVEELEPKVVLEDEDSVLEVEVEVDDMLPLTVELVVLEVVLVVLLPFDAFDSSPVAFDASPDAAVTNRTDSSQLDPIALSLEADEK